MWWWTSKNDVVTERVILWGKIKVSRGCECPKTRWINNIICLSWKATNLVIYRLTVDRERWQVIMMNDLSAMTEPDQAAAATGLQPDCNATILPPPLSIILPRGVTSLHAVVVQSNIFFLKLAYNFESDMIFFKYLRRHFYVNRKIFWI